MAKGKIIGCVCGHEDPDSVVKFVRTAILKRRLPVEQLPRMLQEVEYESVRPFMRAPSHVDRGSRFNQFRQALVLKIPAVTLAIKGGQS